MKQMIQDFLKGLKDGAYGLLLMLLPLAVPQAGSAVHIGLIVAGVIVFVLGVLTNTIQKDFGPLDTWGKVAKDFILGFCTSSIPIIQQGASSGTVWTMILFTCLITGASVFANIISADVTANTMLAKVFKDFTVLGIGAVVPILTADLTSHQSLAAIMGTIGVALLSVASNVINTDVTKVPAVVPASGPGPASTAKLILLLIGFSVLCSPAFAWNVPAQPFEASLNQKLSLGINPAANGEDDLIVMPTANLGFELGNSTPNYGYSGGYDFIFCNVKPGTSAGTVNLYPYFGIGGVVFVDLGPWLDSQLQDPVLASGGINAFGPDLGGVVPGGEFTWNFGTGEKKVLITTNYNFSAFPAVTIIKVLGL